MKNKLMIGILAAGLIIMVTGPVLGRVVPDEMNIQGRITGFAAPGTTSMLFEIYKGGDASSRMSGGTRVWSKEYEPVQIDANGIFNQIIGGVDGGSNPFPEFTDDQPYFLFFQVGSAVMNPGQKLVSVPFAITAKNLAGKVSIEVTSGTAVYGTTSHIGGNIGVYGKGNPGVFGETIAAYSPGVRGKGGTKGVGGTFEAVEGIGVSGIGTLDRSIGVFGKGNVAGGMFEGGAVRSVALKGTSTRGDSVGVLGIGSIVGGSFESIDQGSTALKGVAPSSGMLESTGIYGQGMVGGSFNSSSSPGIALKGVSTGRDSIGIYGKGLLAGGSFESKAEGSFPAGMGIYARTYSTDIDVPAVMGVKGSYSSRYFGELGTRRAFWDGTDSYIGVYGRSRAIGVYGDLTELTTLSNAKAVAGYAKRGYGVYGKSDGGSGVGVFGSGIQAGGSFEATNGPAVYGLGKGSSPGIYGNGASGSGVSGVSEWGHGVTAYSKYGMALLATAEGTYGKAIYAKSGGANAIYAENTGDSTITAKNNASGGIALELQNGGIKMKRVDATATTWPGYEGTGYWTADCNSPVGTIIASDGNAHWVRVRNNYVGNNSIVLATIIDQGAFYGAAGPDFSPPQSISGTHGTVNLPQTPVVGSISSVGGGEFFLFVPKGRKVAFLVIGKN
ncbi:MAG: hypothetical protein PHH60_00990 [Candidatus Margulisbacteria bacterium]|nr:hypothetical protein [Candidatus Margulisiibacteriota bacterium]